MQTVFSIAVDALAYGMVLFVISIGLSVTMVLMRVVNLAHGGFEWRQFAHVHPPANIFPAARIPGPYPAAVASPAPASSSA